MGKPVGGSPQTVSAGGGALASAATTVGHTATGVSQAGTKGASGAAEDPMAGAISRFAAAFSQMSTDLETEMKAAALLANNAAADLATAGGEHPR